MSTLPAAEPTRIADIRQPIVRPAAGERCRRNGLRVAETFPDEKILHALCAESGGSQLCPIFIVNAVAHPVVAQPESGPESPQQWVLGRLASASRSALSSALGQTEVRLV